MLNTDTSPEELGQRIDALDTDASRTLYAVMTLLVEALEDEEGCALMLVDVGDGKLSVISLGNNATTIPLLEAASNIYDSLTTPAGPLQ